MKIWTAPSSAKWHSCKQGAIPPQKSFLFMENISQSSTDSTSSRCASREWKKLNLNIRSFWEKLPTMELI